MLDTKNLRHQYHQETLQETKQVYDELKHLGLENLDAEKMNSVHRVYDFFACLEGHGITFPRNVGKDIMHKLEGLAVKQWCRIYEDTSIAKRAIGRFLPEMTAKIRDAVEDMPSKVKLAIFSGHDSTISPLLSAFKVFNYEYPGFASNVRMSFDENDFLDCI
jgi:hypothetical protein